MKSNWCVWPYSDIVHVEYLAGEQAAIHVTVNVTLYCGTSHWSVQSTSPVICMHAEMDLYAQYMNVM